MASSGGGCDRSTDVGGQVGVHLAPLVPSWILFGKTTGTWNLYQFADGAVRCRVAPRGLPFLKGDAGRDVLDEEGVDAAAVSVAKTKVT